MGDLLGIILGTCRGDYSVDFSVEAVEHKYVKLFMAHFEWFYVNALQKVFIYKKKKKKNCECFIFIENILTRTVLKRRRLFCFALIYVFRNM